MVENSNYKKDLKERGYEGRDYINLARDRYSGVFL